MPSGRTHDRITLWSLPWVTGITLFLTRSGTLALIVAGGFLFSGLLLSPDLDLYSQPFKRWGILRSLWLPYQKLLRHRSVFSHGFIIGTVLRVLYLCCWLGLAAILVLGIIQLFWDIRWDWVAIGEVWKRSLFAYRYEAIALFIGLELGAMSHYLSDWFGSTYKRFKKQGLTQLIFPSKKPKPKKRVNKRPKTRK